MVGPRSVWGAEIVVYLCALQGIGEIDVSHLGLRVELIDLPSTLAMSIPCLFYATEGEMCLRTDRGRVDVRDPRIQLVHRTEGESDIAGIERRRQAIPNVVVDGETLVRRF